MLNKPWIGACGWGGISVVLGDRRRSVESLTSASTMFKEHKLPMNPSLLGYEYFHESTVDAESSISKAIALTLSRTGVDARDVDMLIVASAELPADRQLLSRLLHRNGLTRALPLAITAQECTGLLSAIDLACMHTQRKCMSNILVVSSDRASDDAQRIRSFAVLSDAVVACLVSSTAEVEFVVRGFAHRADLRGMQEGDDFASRKSLAEDVTRDVLAQAGVALPDVKKVLATNFFKPVARFNASSLGLTEHQLYTERAAEFGHCLCGDPLINLADFLQTEPGGCGGDLYLLQAYAPGFLASMLIERAAGPVLVKPAALAEPVVEQAW